MYEVEYVDGGNKGVDTKYEDLCLVCEDPPEDITVEESWNQKVGTTDSVGRHQFAFVISHPRTGVMSS